MAKVLTRNRMSSKRILLVLLAYAIALSAFLTYLDMRGIVEPAWVALATSLVFSAMIFAWYLADSNERAYRRTALFNVVVVLISIIAVPYYLLRSRPRGQRLKAIVHMLGFFALMLTGMLLGGFLVSMTGAA